MTGRLAILVLLVSLAGGCAAAPPVPTADDRTGAVSLDLFVRDVENAAVRYRVEANGLLRFGGGMDAISERFSWSGPMTDAEVAALLDLLDRFGWFESDPPRPARRAVHRGTVRLAGPRGRRRFEVAGGDPGLGMVQDLLATAALRRHEALLETLPRSSGSEHGAPGKGES